jgi:hypothetical protein
VKVTVVVRSLAHVAVAPPPKALSAAASTKLELMAAPALRQQLLGTHEVDQFRVLLKWFSRLASMTQKTDGCLYKYISADVFGILLHED